MSSNPELSNLKKKSTPGGLRAPKTRLSKSAGNSQKDLNDSVFIDVVAYDDTPKSLEVTTVLSKTTSTVIQCPCGMFDRKCIAIKCTSCKKKTGTLNAVTSPVSRPQL